jgi:hypothetical protein
MQFSTADLVGQGGQCTSFDRSYEWIDVAQPQCPSFGGQTFQTNLIMPEPCPFLSRNLSRCSIIRPTETKGVAMGVVTFLTSMGLFIGQSNQFFELLRDLAEDADEARRECQ